MERLLFCCLLACFLHSCSFFGDALLKMKIKYSTHHIINEAGENELDVDFRQQTGVDYDSLYIFEEYCSSYIGQALGIQYKSWHEIPDSYQRLVFIKGHHIANIVDIDESHISFCPDYTERKTIDDSYIVHYGAKYIVKRVFGENNEAIYTYIKKKENGIPLYLRSQAVDGQYIFSEIE